MTTHHQGEQFGFFATAGKLNAQLTEIHQRIQTLEPEIARIAFILYDDESKQLKTYAHSESHREELEHYAIALDSVTTLKECADSGQVRVIHRITDEISATSSHSQWLLAQGYQSSMTVPVYHDDQFIGFIFLNSYQENLFTPQKCTALKPFIDIIRFIVSSEHDLVHALINATKAINAQSPEHWIDSKEHKERISRYARVIALEVATVYQLDDELIENISQFAKCHDIGKLAIPAELFNKPGSLTIEERQSLNQHIEKGIDIINGIIDDIGSPDHPSITVLKEIVAYHHEFLDGSGYPYGLTADAIPVSARIIAVANIFDALTSHRPYKQAWSVQFALLELEKMVASGKLDKHCVNALRYHQDYLKQVSETYPELDPKDRQDTP